MDSDIKKIDLNLPSCPPEFGHHPDFFADFRRCWQKAHDEKNLELAEGKQLKLSELYNPLHPEVFVIPKNEHNTVYDDWGEPVGFERMVFPFSSTDFFVDIDEKGIYRELCVNEAFNRLGGISQLGYLVPPKPDSWGNDVSIVYTTPQFHHTRWAHSLLVAVLTDLILGRNGFSLKERIPVFLASGCHDIATPAGGDSVKRADPVGLDEEANFSWQIRHYGLDKAWKKFGFDLAFAQKIVDNEGLFGFLLDVTDKIAYTALDCYFLGMVRPGGVRDFCLSHPLVMDVWQDIRFSSDKKSFVFSDPDRLFDFLYLRALEFKEFLYNPYSRALDLYLKDLVQPLYEKGILTKEDLLTHDDMWLERFLDMHYPGKIQCYIEPEKLGCRKFYSKEDQEKFAGTLGDRLNRLETISGFSSGLDWKVFGSRSLREVISKDKTDSLEEVIASTRGYYVYYLV